MKAWKLTLLYFLTLSVIVGIAILPGVFAKNVKLGVHWETARLDLGSQPPPEITCMIWIHGPYDLNWIDQSTILLEGFLSPLWTEIRMVADGSYRLFAGFDGDVIANYVETMIDHMGITTPNPNAPAKIVLVIRGYLLPEYDSLLFEGEDDLKVIIPLTNPPPPP